MQNFFSVLNTTLEENRVPYNNVQLRMLKLY